MHSENKDIEMIDNNGIISTYRYTNIETSLLEQGLDLFYMPIERSYYEYIRQEAHNDYGGKISISATARRESTPVMCLYFNNLTLFWNDGNSYPDCVTIEENGTSIASETYDGYDNIKTTITYHDTVSINGIKYNDVMRIKLDDLQLHWNDNTPTEIVFAKDYCIVAYTLNDKYVVQRREKNK